MDCLEREGGNADRNVLRTTGEWRAVANPLAGGGDDRLAGAHLHDATFVLDAERAAEHDGDLLEFRALSGLLPALGRLHARDAHAIVRRIHAAGVFLDAFRFVAGGLDDGGRLNQSRHTGNVTSHVFAETP